MGKTVVVSLKFAAGPSLSCARPFRRPSRAPLAARPALTHLVH